MTTLAERVRDACAATGLNTAAIASRLGISRAAVAQWMNGDSKRIRMERLFGLADMSGFEARWIALGVGPKHRTEKISDSVLTLLACYESADEHGRERIIATAKREANNKPR